MNEYEVHEIQDEDTDYGLCLDHFSCSDDNHAIVKAKEKYAGKVDVYLVRVIGFMDEL